MIVVTFFVGFIFMDLFKKKNDPYSLKSYQSAFDMEAFKKAMIVIGPAIILHEFGHKFSAMAFGANAYFNAAYTFLILGLVLKLSGLGFFFIIPAYVSFPAFGLSPFQKAFIAFAGPLVNLLLYLLAKYMVNNPRSYQKWFKKKDFVKEGKIREILLYTMKINITLFVLNLIPIPPLDGFKVVSNLIAMVF